MKRNLLLLMMPLAACALVLTGCSRDEKSTAKKGGAPVPVLVARAVETNIPVQISAIGNVMAYSKVTIRAQITGQLQETNFREGQEVKKGDLLFTIDPRPAQAALDQARANLARDAAQMENARIQFDRVRKLFADKVASQDEFDTSKAVLDALAGTVAADQAAVTNASLNLEYTAIRAPVDGVIGAQLVYPGNIVKSEDDEMVVLNQIHPIQVAFTVPEQHLAEIKNEMSRRTLAVKAGIAGMTNDVPSGELTFVDNAVDTTTGTIQLKGTFANKDSRLWPGQFVQVRLTLAEISSAIVVPGQAIQTGQNGDYVFVVKSDQTVEMRPVKIGEIAQGNTVVTDGLRAGETVVADGQSRLVPGATVDVKLSLSATTTNTAANP
jgi:membrane fusion protein, multidrug efflux system